MGKTTLDFCSATWWQLCLVLSLAGLVAGLSIGFGVRRRAGRQRSIGLFRGLLYIAGLSSLAALVLTFAGDSDSLCTSVLFINYKLSIFLLTASANRADLIV
jgi:hypothetical protein